MEESFDLQSSMSPKVKGHQKLFRKGTTILASKRNIRRFSIDDKSKHTLNNKDLIIIEDSTESCSSSSPKTNTHNATPIVISDTDYSEDENNSDAFSETAKQNFIKETLTEQKKKLHLGGSLLPEVKLHDIEQWIDRVNTENRFKPDFTIYSELSTIYGDEVGMSFKPEGTGCAVNSTFVESDCVYFDALFGNDKRYMKLGNVPVMVTNKDNARNKEKSSSDIVIDESFVDLNESLKTRLRSRKTDTLISGNRDYNQLLNNSSDSDELKSKSKVYFDGLFENDKRYLNIDNVPGMVTNGDNGRNKEKSSRDIVIDESFADLNESLKTRLRSRKTDSVNSGNVDYNQLNNSSDSDKLDFKSKENIEVQESGDTGNIFYTPKKPITENFNSKDNNFQTDIVNNDLASMLDNLYGNSWREKEEHVLPKTEPRRLLPKPNIYHPKTESKPKFSLLYKNPYLGTETTKSNNLLENLHKARLQMHLESPWSQQLNHLCDSDTQSEDSFKRSSPRKKLDFDSNDDEVDICNDENKISKYFKHKSELANSENNLDKYTSDDESSFLGDTLEERIRKKMNNVQNNKNYKTQKKIVHKKNPLKESSNNQEEFVGERNVVRKGNARGGTSHTIKTKNNMETFDVSSDDEWENEISKIVHESKLIDGKHSFLASLSANVPIYQCNMSARIFRSNFKTYKEQLLDKLFNLYNEKIFDNALPKDTEFEWNDRLRGTAGYCACKKITRKSGHVERKARIVLSTKVIDAAYRLRDTLVHELCHAATWIVNCVSDGHGSYWKAWAYKAMKTFPELPPIKRCHDYVINTKYTYRCTGCGYSIGRHSKSLDIERKRCGYCKGKFEILINKINKKGDTKSVPATPKRVATGFALFVKENYGIYKNDQRKHGEVMKILGKKFQEMKVK